MAYTDNFRIVMRGFHRGDVVQFIRRLDAEHEKDINALKEKNESLTAAMEALRQELDAANRENAALKDRCASAEAALAAVATAPNPAPAAPEADLDAPIPPAPPLLPKEPNINELELAAYRRAELAERLARDRAAAADEQMRALFAQSREKLNLATGDLATVLDSLDADFEHLRQLVRAAQSVLDESDVGVKAVENIFDEP